MDLDLTKATDEDLEARRVEGQAEKDALLAEMRAIVGEQERRHKTAALSKLLEGMSPDERAAVLEGAR